MQKGATSMDLEKTAIIAGERNITFGRALQYIDKFAEQVPSGIDKRVVVFSENSEG